MIVRTIYKEKYSIAHDDPDMIRQYAYQSIMKTRYFYDLMYNGIYTAIEAVRIPENEEEEFRLMAKFTQEQFDEYEKRTMVKRLSGDL